MTTVVDWALTNNVVIANNIEKNNFI